MFKQIGIAVLGICFLFFASVCFAEYKKIKAIGSVETKFIKTATTGQKKLALEDAKKKALDKYIANLDSQRVRILNNVKDQIYQNINTYVPEVIPLNDGHWENGYWNIDVEASINEAQIEELVNKYIQTNIKKKEETYISFVFVAREAESIRKFEGKKTERTVETEGYKEKTAETEGETAGEGTKVYEKVTGGSVEKKADKIKYQSYIPEDINSKVSEVFNKAEFSVVEPFEAGIDTKSFVNDFVESDEISDATKKAAVDAAKAKGLNYLAVATLDVGEQLVDQATGQQKVYVRVNGYIWDLNGKFIKKICSVGPVQYSGLGEDPKVAKTNALINAGTAAAKDLVDQLRVKQGL